ncbi:GDSL esterase/lipase At1g29670-like [Rhododendron vialii]|uniref:GDSL esterase/lipase At1g29670-like n=1 Tax=Rhododendron vialii TaxID=182163 RepID=UPI00265F7390|nr:GDSL esterase/lipase At1g29670-like [Rhododendron vialii]
MLLLLCYLLFNLCGLFSLICQAQSVPNLYVFGDSIFDSGCKSAHAAGLKTGYRPYGIECAWLSPCRFTNGKTIPEIIAKSLKMRPPVTIDETDVNPECGVNYASASAGILLDTGSAFICIYSEDLAWVALNAIHSPIKLQSRNSDQKLSLITESRASLRDDSNAPRPVANRAPQKQNAPFDGGVFTASSV